ncbi:MAG: hypothetical protein J7K65_06510 [Planctomycetes bacterium]|nr:hypothetical protein [Planctomycetota bacterium]
MGRLSSAALTKEDAHAVLSCNLFRLNVLEQECQDRCDDTRDSSDNERGLVNVPMLPQTLPAMTGPKMPPP